MICRRKSLLFLVALAGGLIVCTGRESAQEPAAPQDQAIVHVLNRIGYGPRPGDVERVRAIGLQRYVDEQLHPERVADSGIAARIAPLSTIAMSSREIAERFELPTIEARQARQRNAAAGAADSSDPPMMKPVQQRANSLVLELSEQKVLRAVYSQRQL